MERSIEKGVGMSKERGGGITEKGVGRSIEKGVGMSKEGG